MNTINASVGLMVRSAETHRLALRGVEQVEMGRGRDERAVSRLYSAVTVDIDGDKKAEVRIERQDLDEMLGNLVENAAKYGGGRVFVTVSRAANKVDIAVEDDGPGIPEAERLAIFDRGARLDTTGKPGTGLGLAIVRDVALIYGGTITLGESEDLGGLVATLSLPVPG